MKNGSMFKDVNRYKDEAYFKEHQFFSIYTPCLLYTSRCV